MSLEIKQIIALQEERLREAQLKSDLKELDDLIADELQFVLFDGSVASKAMDLESHKLGLVKIQTIEFFEQDIRTVSDFVATVSVKAYVKVLAQGQTMEGSYRYCRTWLNRGGKWQIVAGSINIIN